MSDQPTTAGFVISAPALHGVDPTDVIDTTDHLDTDHLTPVGAELLRRCATCRTAHVSMAIIAFDQLAQQLDTTTDKVQAAMREIAGAGHGDAKRNTLHIARWTPTVTTGEHTPQKELAEATAPR